MIAFSRPDFSLSVSFHLGNWGRGQEKTMKFRITAGIGVLVAILSVLPRTARAGSLGSDILSMFPKDSGELAYVDLKEARAFPWFNQLKEQMLPAKFREFEKFLSAAGVDPNSQVTELAWSLVAGRTPPQSGGGRGPPHVQHAGTAAR